MNTGRPGQKIKKLTAEDITVVIPAYNEEKAIGIVVKDILKNLRKAEIIVINDGSTDNTPEVARLAGARVIDHDRCRGYGAGLKTGTLASNRDYVLFCDADGQHVIGDIIRLVKEIGDFDMVVGERTNQSYVSPVRAPGKLILRQFCNFLAGEIIPDMNSGLRIIKKQILFKYLHLMPKGFSFSTTTTFAMLKGDYRIKWVPIVVKKRIGESTVRQWKHGPQTLMLILRLTVLFEPLKVFLSTAGFLFTLSLVMLGIDITNFAKTSGISDSTVILSISSLIVFMFGLLCDQVSAMRRESHE